MAVRWLLSRGVLLVFLWSANADAQSTGGTCSNRVLVRYVYAVLLNPGSYEYRAYIRNVTHDTLGWTLSVGSFPNVVSTTPDDLMRGVLAPHAGGTVRIGRGSTAISLDTVEVLYDRTGGAKPFISLHSCSVRPR